MSHTGRDRVGFWMVRGLPLLAAAAWIGTSTGCLEYDLDSIGLPPVDDPPVEEDPPEDPPVDDDPQYVPGGPESDLPELDPPVEDDPPIEDDPPEDELPDCDDTIQADWQWWGSMPFGYEEDPTDGNGVPFYDHGYTMIDYSTVQIPDSGHLPPGYDKVYRATFEVNQLPPALFLSMQSDDGMCFWLNGNLVGCWGGGWQEEGCVNDNAGCTESVTVAPLDVTSYLVAGTNVAAARVSNAVDNAYFEVFTECID